jgi:hypothetical protein
MYFYCIYIIDIVPIIALLFIPSWHAYICFWTDSTIKAVVLWHTVHIVTAARLVNFASVATAQPQRLHSIY